MPAARASAQFWKVTAACVVGASDGREVVGVGELGVSGVGVGMDSRVMTGVGVVLGVDGEDGVALGVSVGDSVAADVGSEVPGTVAVSRTSGPDA